MSEPMEIPEDIREAAMEAASAYHTWTHGSALKHSTPELSNYIATALLAERMKERERAAKVAGNMADEWVGQNGGGACDAVAKAIRSGE